MTDTPIHHWTMDNVTGTPITAAVDEIAGGINLSFSNKTQVTGEFGNGLSGGDTSYPVSLGADVAFKAISMWIRRLATGNYAVFGCTSAENKLFVIQASSAGNLLYFYHGSGASNSNLIIADTNWHHVMVVEGSDANYHWFWLDGVKCSAELLSNLGGVLKFFSRPNYAGGQENTELDNIQWYDRIPTDEEIAYLSAAAAQTQTLPIPPIASLRAILDQPYSMLGDLVRTILDQTYHITNRQLAVLIQVYGLRMLAVLAQQYSDMAVHRQTLVQEYGDCALLRRICRQDYGDAFRYRAALDQEWHMPEGLRAIMEQRYGIAGAQYRAICDAVYDLSERDQLRAIAEQIYVLAAGEALVQRTGISVTCDGVEITSMGNINIEQDEAVYHMAGELQLYNQAEYLLFKAYRSAVVITVDGQTFQFIPEIPRKSRQPGETTYIIPLVSPTIILDAPHSRLSASTLSGMASQIVANLAAPFTVDWRLVDWFIPSGKLATNGDPSITVIKRIAEAAGGLVQTSPAGVLICRPEYPVSVDQWSTATPDVQLTDQDDFFSIAPGPESRPGYNKFFVSDQQLSADGQRLEVVRVSDFVNEIRVYQVPWDESITRIRMRHSGGAWVEQIDQGIVIEDIADEQIEIVAGVGRQTAKPVYQYLSHSYRQADMGALTVTESGEVSTATPGNTLVHITYQTRYFSFLTTDMQTEDVQWYPDDEETTP